MRVIRSSDYRRKLWKNGGGETAEIAIAPAAAELHTFDWRISMARIDSDGPFSVFPGGERTLAVLDGAGIRLKVAEQDAVELTPSSAPHLCPADLATSSKLLGGPITDFNVMTRRGRATQIVRREQLAGEIYVSTGAKTTAIFCVNGRLQASSTIAAVAVGPRDSLLLEPEDARVRITPDAEATVLVVEIAFV